ncbi:MAG: hypothetical protein AB7R89_07970 [Dehalococcoidia bacterium]
MSDGDTSTVGGSATKRIGGSAFDMDTERILRTYAAGMSHTSSVTLVVHPEQLRLLVSEFVRAMRQLPQARAVYLSFADDEPCITTFIDAEPFNRALRNPIYQAQAEVLHAHPGIDVDFRLVNLTEFGGRPPAEFLPENRVQLLHRYEPEVPVNGEQGGASQ